MANEYSLKGMQTEVLISASYLNETESYARYMYYPQIADKEGLVRRVKGCCRINDIEDSVYFMNSETC